MTAIPDAEVLSMYNALRPNASRRAELEAHRRASWRANTAPRPVAALVREAAEVYAAATSSPAEQD